MASMGSFPTGVDSSILLHNVNHRRPMIPILAYRPRKYVVVGRIADCNSAGFSSIMTVDLFSKVSLCNGCSGRRRRWKTQHVKATTEGTGQGETDDESEDALQATIEKGKKVLATQRDLLQQVLASLDLFHSWELILYLKSSEGFPKLGRVCFIEA